MNKTNNAMDDALSVGKGKKKPVKPRFLVGWATLNSAVLGKRNSVFP